MLVNCSVTKICTQDSNVGETISMSNRGAGAPRTEDPKSYGSVEATTSGGQQQTMENMVGLYKQ